LSWRRRKASKDIAVSAEVLVSLADGFSASARKSATEAVDDRAVLMARLSLLPRKQRAAIVLRYFQDYSDAEIAKEIGCAEVSARSNISRGLAKLRTMHHVELRELRTEIA
jgi:RNA polymerase sigma factor (sigma-70 family)